MIKNMIKNKNELVIMINLFCVFLGIILFCLSVDNIYVHKIWVWIISITMILTVLLDVNRIIRPISYFVLSFFVFTWMRIFLNVLLNTSVISIGLRITSLNIHKTALFLGIAMCSMVAIALLVENILNRNKFSMFCSTKSICIENYISIILIILASTFFFVFLLDSINKIKIIKNYNYLAISENILITGYIFFRLGKYIILLWILFGKNKNRMYYASSILLIASMGYLMLGSRGYAICYFFLWLIFFQKKYKINFLWLSLIGIGLIILANKILEYRLGYRVSYGLLNTIINTLHSQGASIEPVFGAVTFRNELLEVFPRNQLFSRGDFGNYIDMVRGVNFIQGGFSTSFFAEIYFLGFPGAVFAVLMALCVGILEHGYHVISFSTKYSNYYNILLFMTCPNLIYFARSDIKDYIFKSLSTYAILLFLIFLSQIKVSGCLRYKSEG